MTPGFFDVAKLDGAGCTGRTVKPSGFATAKKTKLELLILADTGHWQPRPPLPLTPHFPLGSRATVLP
jgi:hypothetical protein